MAEHGDRDLGLGPTHPGRGGGHHYDPNQPRIPAGHADGGQWTEEGATERGNVTPRSPASRRSSSMRGVEVRLPNGWRVVDPYEPTSFLRSPVANLEAVADAGRETGISYRRLSSLSIPEAGEAASFYLVSRMLHDVGTGGRFDYQRAGVQVLGLLGVLPFLHRREFRDVANFNVGLYCQQAGLTFEETLKTAGVYASLFSRNRDAAAPVGLDPQTRDMIASGFAIGESGVYGRPAGR